MHNGYLNKAAAFMLVLLLVSVVPISYADNERWPVYQNISCHYQVPYPRESMVVKSVQQHYAAGFYLSPFDLIDSLSQYSPIGSQIDSDCTAAIQVTANQYVYLFVLRGISKSWPPHLSHPEITHYNQQQLDRAGIVSKGDHHYYHVVTRDAAMSHQVQTDYYFLPSAGDYYVLAFVSAQSSAGPSPSLNKAAQVDNALSTDDVDHILSALIIK